ncbi:MAG: HNH endonuclease family protein [Corynebacterium flavescens]|uniref:HNH endonuclease family protein n=1 Tax=Corynebacterium flavescens TaxID=28028 RepID=UPI00264884BD|nr:HNH endonuclease family protein [Corynebacterium flavescens]MDN6225797.1 HNH endonuclease family protein [Corynebacterium flavescens]MDN6551880.1 HNH endonuclease family protein [Corynebacterium flavescens]MDN6645371.1 HNH endonuclease family protein [Corynebacterium flavescens]
MKFYFLAALTFLTLLYLYPGPRLDIATVPQRQDVLGYDRALFGSWQPHGQCTTREAVRLAQSTQASVLNCRVTGGTFYDPYSDQAVSNSEAVEVDHVFPLSAAWDMGAHSWDRNTRARFANDPLNLVATQRSLNQQKSDSLPSEWLPPKKRCAYSTRLAEIARAYELSLPTADVSVMRRQCRFEFLLPG